MSSPALTPEFARCFARTGGFDSTLARTLGSLQKEREDWDAADDLAGVREFSHRVSELLQTAGYL